MEICLVLKEQKFFETPQGCLFGSDKLKNTY